MRSLGLDVGDKRIGVAISDPLGMLARPLLVLERTSDQEDIDRILKLVEQQQVITIIVGLPRSLNGQIGPQAEKVQQFAGQLEKTATVELKYRDERFTTLIAKDMLESRGKKKARMIKKGEYDAAAAAVILQSYLNETKPLNYPEIEAEVSRIEPRPEYHDRKNNQAPE